MQIKVLNPFYSRIQHEIPSRLGCYISPSIGWLAHLILIVALAVEITKERMKMCKPHVVMLSKQTLTLLKQLKTLTDYQALVLPNLVGNKPVSNMTFNMAMQRVWTDYRIVSHGFRHFFSTQVNESRLFHKDVIKSALAHGDENKIMGTYNLAEYRTERAKLAQWWADELEAMRDGAKVLSFKQA